MYCFQVNMPGTGTHDIEEVGLTTLILDATERLVSTSTTVAMLSWSSTLLALPLPPLELSVGAT